jgi:hypothetical protein
MIATIRALSLNLSINNTIIGRCKEHDTEKNQQQNGTNTVVMLANAETEPTLSHNLKNMLLDKILTFITKSTACQFDIEVEVIISRKAEGNSLENIITEFLNVSRSAVVP